MSTYYVDIVCQHLTNGNLFPKMPTYNVNINMTDTESQVEFQMFRWYQIQRTIICNTQSFIFLAEICHGKKDFNTSHEISIVELDQMSSTFFHLSMDLLTCRTIGLCINMLFVEVKIESLAAAQMSRTLAVSFTLNIHIQ